MTIVRNTAHLVDMLDMLLEQFKDKVNFQKTLKVYARQIQDLENFFMDFLDKQGLADASGPYLDVIGNTVGIPRAGRDDTTYRNAIQIRIAQRSNNATTNDIINNAPSIHVKRYTKTVVGYIDANIDDASFDQLLALLKALVDAGTKAQLIRPSTDLAHTFIVGKGGTNSVGNGLIAQVVE